MPAEAQVALWLALAGFVLLVAKQLERLIVAKVDHVIARMDVRDTNDQRRDLQRDEVQANVRILTNGTGVQHKPIPRAEPQFNGQPPIILEQERRQEPRDPVAHALTIAPDVSQGGTLDNVTQYADPDTMKDRR